MARYTKANLLAKVDAMITQNTSRSNTGEKVNELFHDVIDSLQSVFSETLSNKPSSYTLALADAGTILDLNNSSALTLTIPLNSAVAFEIGTKIEILQGNTGVVTIVGDSGVTLYSQGSKFKTNGIYAVAFLVKRNANEWIAYGNLTV